MSSRAGSACNFAAIWSIATIATATNAGIGETGRSGRTTIHAGRVYQRACAKHAGDGGRVDQFGEVAYGITQTPQVYLRPSKSISAAALAPDGTPSKSCSLTGLLDDMFSAYTTYLRRLAQDDSTERPGELGVALAAGEAQFGNETAARVPSGLLHTPFLSRCANGRIRPLSSRLSDASPMPSSTNTLSVSPEDCDDWARA
jgi:hypothetical protein